jgi:hypothetical protein
MASFTTATVANVVGTTRDMAVTEGELVQGEQLRISKAETGNGALLHGMFTVVLEKMN